MKAAWLVLVFAVGCGGATEVDCVLDIGAGIDPAVPTQLDMVISGDESYATTIDLPHGLPSDGARFVYHPAIQSGTLVFYFDITNDGQATKLGEANTTNVALKPHEAVRVEVTLRACSPTPCN
jgi:hypothetical protein